MKLAAWSLIVSAACAYRPSCSRAPPLDCQSRRASLATLGQAATAAAVGLAAPGAGHAKNLKAAVVNIVKLNTMPNSLGKRAENTPELKMSGNKATVTVPNHPFPDDPEDRDNYIQYLWILDEEKDEVIAVQEFGPNDKAPSISASIPKGMIVSPYAYMKKSGLWYGEGN